MSAAPLIQQAGHPQTSHSAATLPLQVARFPVRHQAHGLQEVFCIFAVLILLVSLPVCSIRHHRSLPFFGQ
jgi:hypothetical protein